MKINEEDFFQAPKKAVKNDQNKLRFDLIPPRALEEVAAALTYGANKYSDNNWQSGLEWSRPYGAAMRHMWAWWRGEDLDPESGLSHLSHAAANIFFLLQYESQEEYQKYDNRIFKEKQK